MRHPSRWARRVPAALSLAVLAPALAACERRGAADPLTNPAEAELAQAAPDSFLVELETSRGNVSIVAHRAWAPNGVDRFYYLVKHHYYDSTYFFRVIESFAAQFGISGTPRVNAAWRERRIPDDSVRHGNTRGTLAFASQGPNTRTTQLFFNLKDNPKLDTFGGGFPPIGAVVGGMAAIDALYDGYGEGPPRGLGPRQDLIAGQGNTYVRRYFPQLDLVKRATIVREWR